MCSFRVDGISYICPHCKMAHSDITGFNYCPYCGAKILKGDISWTKYYYRFSDGWFDYFVNVVTGEKKYRLEDGDIEI